MKRLFIILAAIAVTSVFVSCNKNEKNEPQSSNPIDNSTSDLTGKLSGVFSVSATNKVQFSKGNLQYDLPSKKWLFAAQQYEVQGANNVNEDGVLDLFAWNTNAWKANNSWRILSSQEWNYLLNERTHHQDLLGSAKIDGMMGIILLPDNWSLDSLTHIYTAEQWKTLEEAGAVFLPCAGIGSAVNGTISSVGTIGAYWTSTQRDQTLAWHLFIIAVTKNISISSYEMQGHLSIRLVTDVNQ